MSAIYQLEQELARRVGPFFVDEASAGTTTTVTIPSLQSTLPLGDPWTGQFLLRRGLINNAGFPLVGLAPADRVRRVAQPVDLSSGTITVDRPWTVAPVVGETIELHYLDPVQELRVSVLAGLRRCFLVDRPSVGTSGIAAERDLTALVPWITQLNQIYEIGWIFPGVFFVERPVPWWKEFYQNGHVWISIMPDPFPNNLLITARRGADSMRTVAQLPAPTLFSTPVTWPITGVLNTTPITLQLYLGHPFQTDDWIKIDQGLGAPLDNTSWQVTVVDSSTVTLNNSTGSLNAPAAAPDTGIWPAIAELKLATDPSVAPLVLARTGPFSDGDEFNSMTADPTTGALTINFLVSPVPFAIGETVQVTVDNGLGPAGANTWLVNSVVGSKMTVTTLTGQLVLGSAPFAQGHVLLMRPALLAATLQDATDLDDYPVSLDYGAAAAHMAAWQRFADRLLPAAQAGLKANQQESAAEMTRQAMLNFHPPPKRLQFPQPFPSWQTSRP